MVVVELAKIIECLGRMPSNQELLQQGLSDLANQISKRGGFLAWAKRMGVTRSLSDSDTGWSGEIALAKVLERRGFNVLRMDAVKSPYDLRLNNVLRVDVKSANYAQYGASAGWFYRVGKEPQADIMALYQLDTGVCYFIPWGICPTSNVTISKGVGKYNEFRDRFDILEKLITTRIAESALWPSLKG